MTTNSEESNIDHYVTKAKDRRGGLERTALLLHEWYLRSSMKTSVSDHTGNLKATRIQRDRNGDEPWKSAEGGTLADEHYGLVTMTIFL